MSTTHSRRTANGAIGSVYSGNKIKHLKKEDGIPLWRKDIQLEFLRCVFEDTTECFTMPHQPPDGKKSSFADIYIDTMARSSKTSKVLKEKLLADRLGALHMAMICLLVNVGRMNTTLNFFPEMRAQLRTFHAIPSLQANQDPNAYKQLQDAPRLKSILKGASEDLDQPNTLEKLKTVSIPRTNPVHLIFLFSQFAPRISEAHFHTPRDFFDLVMRGTLSSYSRSRAFLWLVWWYLESDFTAEAALHNPFGAGQPGDNTDGLPIKVPTFEHLTEAQADAENVDTEEEIQYGELKRVERRRILEEDDTFGPPPKKLKRGHEEILMAVSDTDPTRSPSPSFALPRRVSMDQNSGGLEPQHGPKDFESLHNGYPNIASKTDHTNSQRYVSKARRGDSADVSPYPFAPGQSTFHSRRRAPETAHSKAVTHNRKMHVEHILHKQMAAHQRAVRKNRKANSSTFGMMVMNRLKELPSMYDTDDEKSWGPGGLIASPNEDDDYGEEAVRYRKIINRAIRRLGRGEEGGAVANVVKKYGKQSTSFNGSMNGATTKARPAKKPIPRTSGRTGRSRRKQEEQLDDLDLDLLGENRDDGHEDDSALDDTEVEDADMTEDEIINPT